MDSYCGASVPVYSLSELLSNDCFVSGVLLWLPFSLPLTVLLIYGLFNLCRRISSSEYLDKFKGEPADLDAALPLLHPDESWDTPFVVSTALYLAWILSFALMGCGLAEIAMLITVSKYQWFQLVSPATRAVGVAICQALYAEAGLYHPSRWPIAVTLTSWGLSTAAAAWRLQLHMDGGSLQLQNMEVIVDAAYLAVSFCLMLCDAFTLFGITCFDKNYVRLSTSPDSEFECDLAPSPVVATHIDDEAVVYAHDRANFVSQVTYSWLTPLLQKGYQKPIEMDQLGKLPLHDSAALNFRHIYQQWQQEHRSSPGNPSLQRSLWRQFFIPMLMAYVCKQCAELLGFVGPVALRGIVQYMADREEGEYSPPTEATWSNVLANGWVLTLILFVAPFIQSLLMQMWQFLTFRVVSHVQSALLALIYQKALTLNTDTLPADVTVGSIVNHMAVDAFAVGLLFQYILAVFTTPVQIGLTLYLLYWNIGWAGPASLVVILALVPIMACLGKLSAKYQRQMLSRNDERLKLINELLQGIKIIKFYAWEATFVERIAAVRQVQLDLLLRRKVCGAGTICLALSTPALITVTGFGLYALWSSDPLTAGTAFSALSLFNVLLSPMIILPVTIQTWINAIVSGNRIAKFLDMPTMDRNFLHRDADVENKMAVEIDGKFGWNESSTNFDGTKDTEAPAEAEISSPRQLIFDFKAQLPKGTLTMVIGTVGSGKSTLIKAILGDVPCLSGTVHTHGRVAYVAQQAAIFNATVRENILFGEVMDSRRYSEALAASGLQQDLAILPEGDRTEIGEKGINLSGGQKQRISIARALYSQRDIIILDDPLSALDAHVGEHVFNQAVLAMLVAKGKTVLMATHQWQFLKAAHRILLIKGNTIQAQGTMEELMADGYDLQMETCIPAPGDEQNSKDILEQADDEAQPQLRSRASTRDRAVSTASRHSRHSAPDPTAESGRLTVAEERETGAVGWPVYKAYFEACGGVWITIMVIVQVLARVVNVGSTFLLSDWAEQGSKEVPDHPVSYYLGVFIAVTLTSTLVSGAGNVCVSVAIVNAAGALHSKMLDCIVRCPMAFFDTTPLGRILNRFSTDTTNVDMPLPDTLNQSFQLLLNLASYLAALVVVTPVLGAFLLPAAAVYWFLQHFFRCTSRELQRLWNISKSPIFTHLSETLGGLATVRAYGHGNQFMQTNMIHVDKNAAAFITLNTANRWIGLRLDILGALVVSTTAFACIWSEETVSPSLAGLSLSYAWAFVQIISFTIRSCADAEMQMNSVERIVHYTNLEGEILSLAPPTDPVVPPEWPKQGSITFENLSACYRPGLPRVLRHISLRIDGGQRIGVCGRTGSGKSSLLLALFRMLRIEGGRVTVDGVDIATVPLTTLRSRMAVIPQDPVLFAGTVRHNLDPTGQQPNDKVWEAIRVAQLGNVVQSLDDEVGENGENFSTGQRQLFCLGRAFLKHARILCLDEATASVDQDTDRMIQNLMRTAFTECTVITIAHRISTILDYDKVLVLGEGKLLEFDSPNALLQSASVFKSLVDAANQQGE